MNTPLINPDTLCEALVANAKSAVRKATLMTLNELCRNQAALPGSNVTIAAIRRATERAGLFKDGRLLYNKSSGDYRTLIDAWNMQRGPQPDRLPSIRSLATDEWTNAITDPALRALVEKTVIERNTFRAQVNTLKNHAQVTIDRRPLGVSVVGDGRSTVAILEASAQLTETERETLKSAVDPDCLAKKGLREGARGEIIHERTGELLLDLGFTAAIRKILRLEPQTPAIKKRITGIG